MLGYRSCHSFDEANHLPAVLHPQQRLFSDICGKNNRKLPNNWVNSLFKYFRLMPIFDFCHLYFR